MNIFAKLAAALIWANLCAGTACAASAIAQEQQTGKTTISFYEAAKTGDLQKVRDYIGQGYSVNRQNKESLYETALHEAAGAGQIEVVNFLLAKGANANAENSAGRGPLFWAARNGHLGVAKTLLTAGANVHARDYNKYTPLRAAAKEGHSEMVSLLLQNGAEVNAKNDDNKTALTWAVFYQHTDTSKILLAAGADPNIGSPKLSPLRQAVGPGNIKLVKMLLDSDANVDAVSVFGYSPLGLAIKERDNCSDIQEKAKYTAIVQLLSERGAKDVRPGSDTMDGAAVEEALYEAVAKNVERGLAYRQKRQATPDRAATKDTGNTPSRLLVAFALSLIPPLLLRFAILKRPIRVWPAIGIAVLLLFFNVLLFGVMAHQPGRQAGFPGISAGLSIVILSKGPKTKKR